jgi:hypothetical protein
MSYPPVGYYVPQDPNAAYRDAEHLRLLAIFHFVAGGIFAFFGCFPVIYIFLGIMMVSGKMNFAQNTPNPPPPQMGYIFITIGAVIIALAWGLAISLFISGRYLQQRRGYIFSMIVAAISCLQVPFGTILGVFTIIVLARQSVKALYGRI